MKDPSRYRLSAFTVDAAVRKKQQQLRRLMALIGRTPLVRINYTYDDQPRAIYAKYEALNMTGSVKDRMAAWILHKGYETHALKSDSVISTVSSGNTGVSFAALGAALGHQVRVYMPAWMSHERRALIQSFGAEIVNVSRDEGGFVGAIEMEKQFYAENQDSVFVAEQFDNISNTEAHYLYTGHEIAQQLIDIGSVCHAFVAGVGTGGTVIGVGKYLREFNNTQVRVYGMEPKNSPTLSTGVHLESNTHRIQGISDEFVPGIIDYKQLTDVVGVWDDDAIQMTRLLGKHGLGVGISSGANFLGAVSVVEETIVKHDIQNAERDLTVATVFSDSNKKYLSTDLFSDSGAVINEERCEFTPRIAIQSVVAFRM